MSTSALISDGLFCRELQKLTILLLISRVLFVRQIPCWALPLLPGSINLGLAWMPCIFAFYESNGPATQRLVDGYVAAWRAY